MFLPPRRVLFYDVSIVFRLVVVFFSGRCRGSGGKRSGVYLDLRASTHSCDSQISRGQCYELRREAGGSHRRVLFPAIVVRLLSDVALGSVLTEQSDRGPAEEWRRWTMSQSECVFDNKWQNWCS